MVNEAGEKSTSRSSCLKYRLASILNEPKPGKQEPKRRSWRGAPLAASVAWQDVAILAFY